jgi:ferric-dicitrate binding protein FerR (iron transport regulator)
VNHQPDERLDAYLWDPAASPDASVVEIERRLAPARFDAASHPLPLQRRDVKPRVVHGFRWWTPRLALAAAVLLAVSAGWATWRWSWPEGGDWVVQTPSGTFDGLAVGSTLQTDASESAFVRIARIGTMQVGGGSSVTLRSTSSNRHRLVMQEGVVKVSVWAPPSSVAFRTPAGDVIDMGCEFELSVTRDASHVRVSSGWVQLDNLHGETLVPAGASSLMTADVRPGVAVYDDAPPGFREAVRTHESNPGDPLAVERVVQLARTRDVLTLLQLARRRSQAIDRFVTRAAELFPPPDPADQARALSGDGIAIDRWKSALPLPPPKGSWLWNWRDGFSLGARPSSR